jgi:hypothetical protein
VAANERTRLEARRQVADAARTAGTPTVPADHARLGQLPIHRGIATESDVAAALTAVS